MTITNEIKDGLNVAFNESKLNYIDITQEIVVVILDFLGMDTNNEFPEDSRVKIIFKPYGRIAISSRKGEWDDAQAEIVELDENELNDYFSDLKLDSMYGWEFINIGGKNFEKWSDKLSLDKQTSSEWNKMNTIDLFGEQYGPDAITIDVRIWFDSFEVFGFDGKKMTTQEFIEKGQSGWNQLYKTGIKSENHRNYKMKE